MKFSMGPNRKLGWVVLLGMGVGAAIVPFAAAQARGIVQLVQEPNPLLRSSSQGYLGVDLADVDQDKAQSLKLKDVRGAIITLIDHDAPAGQIGLRVNDVVLTLNGQAVEGAEQLRRMLREIPAGHKVSLVISRDGVVQTVAVELADRRAMEHDIWNKLGTGSDVFATAPGMGILAGGGDAPISGGFHMPFFGSSLNVGALVEPLTSQMAEYLGVPNGLMVKQVARKSEAATAGLKAFDVILKVGSDAITTLADWDRSLRSNQGKPVQVTILRDKKQQTLTLQVDSKHHGSLEIEETFPGFEQQIAEAGQELSREWVQRLSSKDAAAALAQQMEALKNEAGALQFKLDPKQMDELKQQMEHFGRDFKPEDFKLDPKQMEQFRRQMDEFQRTMPEKLKLDKGGMDQLKNQMQQFKQMRIVPPQGIEEQMRKQMEELKRQMQEWQALGYGDRV